jgi:hypothetical protein
VLIPAGSLVNGTSVAQLDRAEVIYHHRRDPHRPGPLGPRVTGEVEVTVTDPSDRDRLPGGGETGPEGATGATGPVICFARGTMILTPEGERPVEARRRRARGRARRRGRGAAGRARRRAPRSAPAGPALAQLDRAEVIYHHVELPVHDVLVADGMPAESYLDCRGRGAAGRARRRAPRSAPAGPARAAGDG